MSFALSAAAQGYVSRLVFGGQLWAARPSTFYMSLHTLNLGTAGFTEALLKASEVNGNGYTRIAIGCNNSNWTVAKDTVTNAQSFSSGAATQSWGTITYVALWSAATNGTLLFYGALDNPPTIAQFGSFSMPAGQMSIQAGGSFGQVMAFKVLRYLFQAAAWTAIPTLYFGYGTNADQSQLYGEPVTIENGGTDSAYQRGSQANKAADWPASTSTVGATSNAYAVTNFPPATADWGALAFLGILDKAIIIGKTWTQSAYVVTITDTTHGLTVTTLPSNPALGALSGTYAIAGTAVTITLPYGHGVNTGDTVVLTYSGGNATSGFYVVQSTSATTITVTDSGGNGSTGGTVSLAWPQYVDLWFQSFGSTGGTTTGTVFPTSQRYMVNSVPSSSTFTVTAPNVTQTADRTNAACEYSLANVLAFGAMTTPLTINQNDTSSTPAGGITAQFS